MRYIFLLFLIVLNYYKSIFPQAVVGYLIDENNKALMGVSLNLYSSGRIYSSITDSAGGFNFEMVTSIKEDQLPDGFEISGNFPNPFNPRTRFEITLPQMETVKIDVLNLLGEVVAERIERVLSEGKNTVDIELNGLANGIYFSRIIIGEKYTLYKKMILLYGSNHLSCSSVYANKNMNEIKNEWQQIYLDSIVAYNKVVGKKVFVNLPNYLGGILNLGNLIFTRYCENTPSILYSGKLYHTIKIGTQCWLRENLNVGVRIDSKDVNDNPNNQNNNGLIEKYCYNDIDEYCDLWGGFYQWSEAMDYKMFPDIRGICPLGWHIPTKSEYETLKALVDEDGNSLKALGQGIGYGIGTNYSGFSAILSGYRSINGKFFNMNDLAYFYSSSGSVISNSWNLCLEKDNGNISINFIDKKSGYNIRCIKD